MKKLLLSLLFAQFAFNFTLAQTYTNNVTLPNGGKMPPGIHVDGNNLKDDAGNKVVLHGYMDTPSPWFNSNRWGTSSTDGNLKSCIYYFAKLFKATTNPEKGTYCNIFRLHLDPCWTNDPKIQSTGSESGEANISQFSQERLKKYLIKLYVPIAQVANSFGMHVIMRPPGVCPGDIYVDGDYQKYLIKVWDEVTKNDTILKYYKHISLELANEPVRIRNASGVEKDQNLRDFFQPVIDKIRANGYKGIIWIPGTGWQASYSAYAKYPVVDPIDNLGFAVHNYPGWYSNSDDGYTSASNKTQYVNNAVAQFERQVPVVRTNPVVITEVDWSPKNPGTGHYNEHNEWVESNYGTWATGSTSKWGKGYKATLEKYGNISMTLSGTDTYVDYASISTKELKPAFSGVEEACGETCWKWYEEYAKVNYPSNERYQPAMVVPENPLSLEAEYFIPQILHENTMTKRSAGDGYNLAFTEEGSSEGWRFEEPMDFSGYKYLILKCLRNPQYSATLCIYDTHNYWADHAEMKVTSTTKVPLEGLKTLNGREIDLKNIRLITIKTSQKQTVYVANAFLSMDGENAATAISSVSEDAATDNNMYDISGRLIKGTPKGFYIKGGKKYFGK